VARLDETHIDSSTIGSHADDEKGAAQLPRVEAELELIAARISWEVGRLARPLGVHYNRGGWQLNPGLHRVPCILARHEDDLL